MIAFGTSPLRPIEPNTTIIIGAIARIGMVCEVMIHGKSERSSVRTCTMPTASTIPSTAPMAKPKSVDDAVTQAWNSRLRFEESRVPTVNL